MMNYSKKGKRIVGIVIGLMLLVGQSAFVVQEQAYGLTSFAVSEASEPAVLAFTSDVHNDQKNYKGETRLGTWIDNIVSKYGKIDAMAFGGDMARYDAPDDEFWSETERVMNVVDNKGITAFYTTGNHEYDHSSPDNTNDFYPNKNDSTKKYIQNDWAVEDGPNYRIYCMGVGEASGYTYQKNSYTANQVTILGDKLAAVDDNSKPIFIITHFPLHCWSSRTIERAPDVIDVLNNAATGGTPDDPSDDKKIVFLWGHNHSQGDTNYDKIRKKGYKIQYDSDSSHTKEIQFYYAAAGCMSDSEKDPSSGKIEGKGLVATVNSKGQLALTYYKADGSAVTKNGAQFNEQDPDPVERFTIDEGLAGEEPLTVGEGKTRQLHTSVVPSTATGGAITWGSSNESVATVDNKGKVTGVSKGTAEITAILVDSVNGQTHEASVYVSVVPVITEVRFIEASKLTDGKEYIIGVTKDSSSVYAIDNASGSGQVSTATLPLTTADGSDLSYIITDKAGVGWTYTSSNNLLSNQGKYLNRAGSSGNYYPTATTDGREAIYTGGNLQLKKSSSSSIYYLTCSNGTFGLNNSSSGAAQVRLFEKTEVDIRAYSIRFENEDGALLQQKPVAEGRIPSYTGETPTKAASEDYTYTFAGWTDGTNNYDADDTLPAATADVTYTARYDETAIHHHKMTVHPGKEATCTTGGSYTYWSCDICNKFFADEAGEYEVDENDWVIPAGHDWSKPTYTWAEDNSSVTAEYHCMREGCGTKVTETANSVSEVIKQPACTEPGETKYSASFKDSKFAAREKVDKTKPAALGHDYQVVEGSAKVATQTANGKEADQECSRCHDVITGKIIPAIPPSEIRDLPAVKILKPQAGKKKVTVKWKKPKKKVLNQIQGYEVRVVGQDKDVTRPVGKKKTSKKIGGLKSKKKYKVMVRAYKYDGKVMHVSAWKSKTVKVK